MKLGPLGHVDRDDIKVCELDFLPQSDYLFTYKLTPSLVSNKPVYLTDAVAEKYLRFHILLLVLFCELRQVNNLQQQAIPSLFLLLNNGFNCVFS